MYDRVEIKVKAGNGGHGVVSFRRESFVPYGGPDGGDGGDGGNLIIRAETGVTSLREYAHKRNYKAGSGHSGMGGKKYGKRGTNLVLSVPVGTVVREKVNNGSLQVMADLTDAGQQVVVAWGGKGGIGNTRFASSTNQVPRLAQKGENGEEKDIVLELKILADVGIIGYPNAGKSTLLSKISAAKPKIADYPFTTLEPVLGTVEAGNSTFVVADVPGIIDGAHLGKGLGHDFLRHVERTVILLHLVDGSAADPAEYVAKIDAELSLYDPGLGRKPQLVVVNKLDLPEVRSRIDEIRRDFKGVAISPVFISAATGEGVPELLAQTAEMLTAHKSDREPIDTEYQKVFRPQPVDARSRIRKQGQGFLVVAADLERIVAGSDVTNPEVFRQLLGLMAKSGVNRELEKAGVKPGDAVRCGNMEWTW